MKDLHEDTWLTPEELNNTFGIKLSRQARLRSEKRIPFSKIKNIIRYNQSLINKWLRDAEVPLTNTLKDPN